MTSLFFFIQCFFAWLNIRLTEILRPFVLHIFCCDGWSFWREVFHVSNSVLNDRTLVHMHAQMIELLESFSFF